MFALSLAANDVKANLGSRYSLQSVILDKLKMCHSWDLTILIIILKIIITIKNKIKLKLNAKESPCPQFFFSSSLLDIAAA